MRSWIHEVTELLFDQSFMTLATADGDALPWASPVEFACDEQLRFYWRSLADVRHSGNVRENPWAAFAIYDGSQTPGVSVVQGLYGEGPVEELSASELETVRPSISRWIAWRDRAREIPRPQSDGPLDSEARWRFYRVDPADLYALDPGVLADNRLADSRVPVDLAESFALAYRSRIA